MRPSFRAVTMMFALMLGILLSPALATDLGQALNFGVLSTGGVVTFGTDAALSGGDIGGTGILLQRDASITNDLVASPNGINMKKGSNAANCITGGKR
jgi:hypothetical protein